MMEDSARNIYVGVSTPFEVHREMKRNREWAEAAWQGVGCKNASGKRNDDYACGFKDGYAEYLFRGGDGEPPLVAPLKYRHIRYQTPEGYQAIEDWFAGYRHGAATARDSGARHWITGPSALEAGMPMDAREPHLLAPGTVGPMPEVLPSQPTPVPPDPMKQSSSGEPPLIDFGLPLANPVQHVPPPPPADMGHTEPRVFIKGANAAPLEPEMTAPPSLRARITGINAPQAARITGISVAPEESAIAPVRAKIMTITPAP
jgi:hypothetical protein